MNKVRALIVESELLRILAFLIAVLAIVSACFRAHAEPATRSNNVAEDEQDFQQTDEEDDEASEVAAEVKAASPSEDAAASYILKDVKTFSEGDAFVTQFTFDRPFEDDNLPIDFIHQTVQINLPHAHLKGVTKKTNSVQDELVSRVVTFQRGTTGLRSQILLKKGQTAKQLEAHVQIVKNKNTLQVRLVKSDELISRVTKSLPVIKPIAVEAPNKPSIDELLQQAAAHAAEVKAPQPEAAPASVMADPEKTSLVPDANAPTASAVAAPTTDVNTNLTTAEKNEAEIPVFTATKEKTHEPQPFQRMVISLGIVAALGLGILYALRRYSRRNTSKVPAIKIKVLTQHHLGPKKSLAIIQVAGESMLIGITDHNVSMIKSLSLLDEDLPDQLPSHFTSALGSSMRGVEEANYSIPANSSYAEESDEFSMRGLGEIKTLVSRKIKNMGSIE
jgi:flagellar protein FliO/FliZ